MLYFYKYLKYLNNLILILDSKPSKKCIVSYNDEYFLIV